MVQEFEIIQVINHHNRGQIIFARQINTGQDFNIKEGSLLGDVPIDQYLDMPRILDNSGQPRLDVFVFRPLQNSTVSSPKSWPFEIREYSLT